MGADFKPADYYSFSSVDRDAKLVEYYDYTLRLCDLNLIHWFFRMFEIEGNLEERLKNSEIGKSMVLYSNS